MLECFSSDNGLLSDANGRLSGRQVFNGCSRYLERPFRIVRQCFGFCPNRSSSTARGMPEPGGRGTYESLVGSPLSTVADAPDGKLMDAQERTQAHGPLLLPV